MNAYYLMAHMRRYRVATVSKRISFLKLKSLFNLNAKTLIFSDLKDDDCAFRRTCGILEQIGVMTPTLVDCKRVAYACKSISTRAAHLCAAGIATLLNRMQKLMVTVGVDGYVCQLHPTFKDRLESKIEQLVDDNLKVQDAAIFIRIDAVGMFQFRLMLSEGGSTKGAALAAAVACRIEQKVGHGPEEPITICDGNK